MPSGIPPLRKIIVTIKQSLGVSIFLFLVVDDLFDLFVAQCLDTRHSLPNTAAYVL